MTAPARVAAYHALRAIAGERADLPTALAETRRRLSDERDRALAAEIVSGTLRWQRALDYIAEQVSSRPVDKLDSEVRLILRLSLYQLLHLDRVPAAAVVDDAAQLTRRVRKTSAVGFVNAVLRSTIRRRTHLPLPQRPTTPADAGAAIAYLGVTHSHPEWLVRRWLHRHGFEATEQWVRFNNSTPQVALRANTLRWTREEVTSMLRDQNVETTSTLYAPDGLVATSGNPLRASTPEGAFFVQEEASQVVGLMVGARPGERVLDVCAAPGGKTVAMAAAMRDTGSIVACDVRSRRVSLLSDTVRMSGASIIRIVHIDSTGHLPFTESFDRVVVDAPCSGLGTLRRDPDIRWRRHEEDLAEFARQQLQLLERTAPLVRPGGRLVYATCSSEPEENEQIASAFVARHQDFVQARLDLEATASVRCLIDSRGMLRTLPFAHGLEAFFAVAIDRSGT